MAARWLPLALLPLLLTSCEARPSLHPTSTVRYRSTANGAAREASLPAALGILVPDVSGYRCSGTYQPALAGRLDLASLPPQVGTPLWQLSVTCIDPRLTAGVPQGPVPPRAVLLFEYPSTLADWERTVTHVRRFSLDGRLAALTDIGHAGYELGVLGFARGESSWQGFGMHLGRSLLVSHFGRQVRPGARGVREEHGTVSVARLGDAASLPHMLHLVATLWPLGGLPRRAASLYSGRPQSTRQDVGKECSRWSRWTRPCN